MTEPEQMADLVKRNRLDVEPVRLSARGYRPVEERVQKDLGLDDLPGDGVDEEGRRAERPTLIGLIRKADHCQPVVIVRPRLGEAGELGRDARGLDGRPAVESAIHRIPKLRRRDAAT